MSFESSRKEGEIAEQMVIDFFNHSKRTFYDARNDKLCRHYVIDFITLKNNHTKEDILKNIESCDENEIKEIIEKIGCAIEVKLDKVTHNRHICKNGKLSYGSRKFVYEIISHNKPGWAARCRAHYILYFCIDTFDEIAKLSEVYLIDFNKLKNNLEYFISNGDAIKKELPYVMEEGVQVKEDIVNYLINIDAMKQKEGVCKVVTEYFIDFFPKNLHIKK